MTLGVRLAAVLLLAIAFTAGQAAIPHQPPDPFQNGVGHIEGGLVIPWGAPGSGWAR